jgi:hypothetical protein
VCKQSRKAFAWRYYVGSLIVVILLINAGLLVSHSIGGLGLRLWATFLGCFFVVNGLVNIRFRYDLSEALAVYATRSCLVRLTLVPYAYKPRDLIVLGLFQLFIGVAVILDAVIGL